jgi:hypothetical protein
VIYPIVRMYGSAEVAAAAVSELQEHGFRSTTYDMVKPPSTAPEDAAARTRAEEEAVAAMVEAYVPRADARIYAPKIVRGYWLVIVRAPFGSGVLATQILHSHQPVDSGIVEKSDRPPPWDEAVPLSSALQAPLIMRNAAPFSGFWGLPVLTRGRTTCTTLRVSELADPQLAVSGKLGMPLLSGKAAPLSGLLGLRLLATRAAPLSATLKLPLLSRKAAPLSSLLGLPILTRRQ